MDVWLAWIALVFVVGSCLAIIVPGVKATRQGTFADFSVPKQSWVVFGVLLLISFAFMAIILLN